MIYFISARYEDTRFKTKIHYCPIKIYNKNTQEMKLQKGKKTILNRFWGKVASPEFRSL